MTNFKAWIPPAGEVVKAPVHPETRVDVFFSDRSEENGMPAKSINWSSVGDGPRVVAYAVVQEYKPGPVLRDFWITIYDGNAWDTETLAVQNNSAFPCGGGAIIHVREVPDPSREVVAWAVLFDDGTISEKLHRVKSHAEILQNKYGGTVVRLSGVMP